MNKVPEEAGTRPAGAAGTATTTIHLSPGDCASSPFSAVHKVFSGQREAADLGAKAAATLWCVRRGVPAPNAAAAATSDRRERERVAVRCNTHSEGVVRRE